MTPRKTAKNKAKAHSNPMICLCNGVRLETILKAIEGGARSLDEIFDQTTAGVGPCGGSCRDKLRQILAEKLKPGEQNE